MGTQCWKLNPAISEIDVEKINNVVNISISKAERAVVTMK